MKIGAVTTDILIAAFVASLILGFVFPYSIFAMVTPLVVILWVIGFAGNFMVLWSWYAVPAKTKELRQAWKPCHKTLPIVQSEVFAFQQAKPVKYFLLPVLLIICLIGIWLLCLIPTEGLYAAIMGSIMLVVAGGIFLAITRCSHDEIVASSEGLKFNTSWNKATVPWSEVLSIIQITAYGIESYRVYTTKHVLTYNDRYKNYQRLTDLIRRALQEPDMPD